MIVISWIPQGIIKEGDTVEIVQILSLVPQYDREMQRKFHVGSQHKVLWVDGNKGVELVGARGFAFSMEEVEKVC